MHRFLGVLALLATAGCSYLPDRARDFGDMFRLEFQAGYGLSADVVAGELAHVGLGSGRQWSAGLTYGTFGTRESVAHYLPVSYVATLVTPEQEHLHKVGLGENETDGVHRCYMLFPGELNPGTIEKPLIHYLDIEAGVMAGFLGIRVGFSLGELLDFILGLFKFSDSWTFLDPAGDDTPGGREARGLWRPRSDGDGRPRPR